MPTKGNSTVLDILNSHLNDAKEGCVVGKWVDGLSEEEKSAFALIKEKNSLVSLNGMYRDIADSQDLPFGMTSFRTHFRGTCTCQKTS